MKGLNFLGLTKITSIFDGLSELGEVAGIAGVVVGTLLIIYRQIIAKKLFPTLTKKQSFTILLIIIIATWSIAIAGISAWAYDGNTSAQHQETSNISNELMAIKSLNNLNYTLYKELKKNRIDTTLDTYQNLQIMRVSQNPKTAFYQSNVTQLRKNNQKISEYLIELKSSFKNPDFKKTAEQFIQHAGLVETRYDSAMTADSLSDLPKITIKYPNDFVKNLDKEIDAWHE